MSQNQQLQFPQLKTSEDKTLSFDKTNQQTPVSNQNESDFFIKPPAITLPKGGGAIKGIGEKFNANPFTGTANITLPIYVSPGRDGFQPDLNLSYGSGSGNGVFGMGWNLSLPAITRKTDRYLPEYDDENDSDIFILAGAEELVPQKGSGSEIDEAKDSSGELYHVKKYLPRVVQAFSLIEKWTRKSDGDVHWRTLSKDNITSVFGRMEAGKDENTRIADPIDPTHIFSWLLCEMQDGKGNLIRYAYKPEDETGNENYPEDQRPANANRYIKTICYGNEVPDKRGQSDTKDHQWYFQLVFDYGDHVDNMPCLKEETPWAYREDAFSSYRAGFEIRTRRRCQRILMFHHFPEFDENQGNTMPAEVDGKAFLVASTELTFSEYADESPYTLLQSVTRYGYKHKEDGTCDADWLPPVEFKYVLPKIGDQPRSLIEQSLKNLPEGLAQGRYQLIDLDGVGVPGILTDQGGHWHYKECIGHGSFSAMKPLPAKPSPGSLSAGQQLQDLDGNGLLCLVSYTDALPGFFQRSETQDWEPFVNFKSLPNIDWQDPNLQMLDLNGDGFADVLISEGHRFVWYPSLGRGGFGAPRTWNIPPDESQGPVIVFEDSTNAIYISDMIGDGLRDIVRIRNGSVCYWPNLGYGRFGPKRSMENAPVFDTERLYNPRQLRLADIDGSGTTDLIYLNGAQTAYWLNLSGNRFAKKQTIPAFPHTDNLSTVQLADMEANGTSCLAWSSSLPCDADQPLKYVPLMADGKPYLLKSMENGMGGRTEIDYKPSTWFYLEDKKAGKPWQTRLPMPVHVVETVRTIDLITNTAYTNKYTYHHGYFDGPEREFRGFGCVEQEDTDNSTVDNALDQPPVKIRTWFHTGAWPKFQRLEEYFRSEEYYREDNQAWFLPDTLFAPDIESSEQREAARALTGSILRQEIYADDGTDQSGHPYTVSEQSYRVIKKQTKGANPYAVFTLQPLETLNYHYERDTQAEKDPLISHQINLHFDAFNNVTHSAAIAYPRRSAHQMADYAGEQNRLKVTYQYTSYCEKLSDPADYQNSDISLGHRHSVPCEQISWEYCNPEFSRFPLSSDDLPFPETLPSIKFFQSPVQGTMSKRLLSHLKHYFCDDDTTAALDFQHIGFLALPHQSFQLAFSKSMLQEALGSFYDDPLVELLNNEAKYQVDGENYWCSSGYQEFDKKQFYQPTAFVDPFGNRTAIERYWRNLIPIKITDPLDNTVEINTVHPYNLQPKQITDINDNVDEVAFDILGQVVATARHGRQFDPDAADPGSCYKETGFFIDDDFNSCLSLAKARGVSRTIDDLINSCPLNTNEHLKRAGSRVFIDPWRFKRDGKPMAVLVATRENFAAESSNGTDPSNKIQTIVSYQDGLGRTLVSKQHVNDGKANRLTDTGVIEEIDTTDYPDISRWLATGRVVYNNKGNPVKEYEPYFCVNHRIIKEDDLKWGVSSTLIYDPLGRVIKSLLPDRTFTKVEFSPWHQKAYDQNDTVLESDWFKQNGEPEPDDPQGDQILEPATRAAWLAAQHADTPTETRFDNLGRPFVVIDDNRTRQEVSSANLDTGNRYVTRTCLDILGNALSINNALGDRIIESQYDYLGNALRSHSVDSGDRRAVGNCAGSPYLSWDAKKTKSRTTYDALQRPVSVLLKPDGKNEKCIGCTIYGENPWIDHAVDKNLRGQPALILDTSGITGNINLDIMANPIRTERQLLTFSEGIVYDPDNPEIDLLPEWAPAVELVCTINADKAGFDNVLSGLLDPETYLTETTHDALGRPTNSIYNYFEAGNPDVKTLVGGQFNDYNRMGLLARIIALDHQNSGTEIIKKIDYNAKGQRESIIYGNDVRTTYEYDPKNLRLISLISENKNRKKIQELCYTYDPVGNITHIQDKVQSKTFFNNHSVNPDCEYEYDALYRLTQATGREHLGQTLGPALPSGWNDADRTNHPLPNDSNALARYRETYQYDPVGNIIKMNHLTEDTGVSNWARTYTYQEDSPFETGGFSHRLSSTIVNGGQPEYYHHDANGNIDRMQHLQVLSWNLLDELQATSRQNVNNGGLPETTFYQYDSGGQRVRKITFCGKSDSGNNVMIKDERRYLGDFEIYWRPKCNDDDELKRMCCHIMDDQTRVAIVETKTVGSDDADGELNKPLIRYQLGNHLGSVAIELDGNGVPISYEEHYPYGATSYQMVNKAIKAAAKRYRYNGKERDEESGFYYYGVRYYSSWIGRWCAVDKVSMINPKIHSYSMCENNPVRLIDDTGEAPREALEQLALRRGKMLQEKNMEDAKSKDTKSDSISLVQKTQDEATSASLKTTLLMNRLILKISLAPKSSTGAFLSGPLKLWTMDEAYKAALLAKSGYMVEELDFWTLAGRGKNVIELSTKAAQQAATSEVGALSYGLGIWEPELAEKLKSVGMDLPKHKPIQLAHEIPAFRLYSLIPGALMMLGGGFTLYGAFSSDELFVKMSAFVAGSAEAGAGLGYIYGAYGSLTPNYLLMLNSAALGTGAGLAGGMILLSPAKAEETQRVAEHIDDENISLGDIFLHHISFVDPFF